MFLVAPETRDYLGYTREFPDLDGLIIVVRAAPDRARAEHFVDALAARLNADHANVKTVFYKIDAGAFADRAMLYMKSGDLDVLAQKIRAYFVGAETMAETGTSTKPRDSRPRAQTAIRAMLTG